jgi:hypothetical protein
MNILRVDQARLFVVMLNCQILEDCLGSFNNAQIWVTSDVTPHTAYLQKVGNLELIPRLALTHKFDFKVDLYMFTNVFLIISAYLQGSAFTDSVS